MQMTVSVFFDFSVWFRKLLQKFAEHEIAADSHKKEHKNAPEKQQPKKPAFKQEQSPAAIDRNF